MRPTSPTQHRGRETSSKCESSCDPATVSNAYVEGCGTSITPREELNSLSPWVPLTCAVDIIACAPVAEDEKPIRRQPLPTKPELETSSQLYTVLRCCLDGIRIGSAARILLWFSATALSGGGLTRTSIRKS